MTDQYRHGKNPTSERGKYFHNTWWGGARWPLMLALTFRKHLKADRTTGILLYVPDKDDFYRR